MFQNVERHGGTFFYPDVNNHIIQQELLMTRSTIFALPKIRSQEVTRCIKKTRAEYRY